ncbi:uncharacterized protein LOC118645237 [Monomorium pharaonis]|uniref:uncharacterized protein LOC105828941 n=1 Tax=Monomorium pharaonis TaxID=307658 RepID=UPI00063F990A|nr:uncharacterized protein LOC105828941 [Monomorium pharaonis]XP_036141824.1 uncharacterized protein LOC118645237 [Monomorium pharaonis]
MLLRVNLVAILLTLNCVSRATEHSRSVLEKWQREERAVTSDKKILRYTYDNVTSESSISSVNDRNASEVAEIDRSIDEDIYSPHSKIEVKERDEARRKKRKAGKTMLALLMAYKLKFVALIPTILGGLILLKGTTLLAGFFFALFAAVLGLKIH